MTEWVCTRCGAPERLGREIDNEGSRCEQCGEVVRGGASPRSEDSPGDRHLPARWVLGVFVVPAGSLIAVWLNRREPYEDFAESLGRSWGPVAASFALPILIAVLVAFHKKRPVAGTLGLLAIGIPLIEGIIIRVVTREPCPPLDEWCGFGRGYGTLAVIVLSTPFVLVFAISAVVGACRRPLPGHGCDRDGGRG